MNKVDLSLFNWVEIQNRHDSGICFSNICIELNISQNLLRRAINEGLFIKHTVKRKLATEETKQKISEALKLSHSTGKHPGWAHINSRKDKTSYPERFFLNVLKNNGLFDKYHIEQKLCIGKYFLDFAVIDLKLNIEIDGQQHFRNDENIEHDKIRNEYLINKGWKVYRISWVQMYQNTKEEINTFLKYINNINNETNRYYIISDIVIKSIPKYGTRLDYNIAKNKIYDTDQKQYIDKVLNSNIEFHKFGWVNKVASIINKNTQHVNIWMKKYMPDHYTNKCFKRKSKK